MNSSLFIFILYLFFALYCTGSMMVLQIQHFALYPLVGKESFKEYIKANNKAAFLPAIVPAILLLITTIILLFSRPAFMSLTTVISSLIMNLINITSTAIWQGKIHAQLEKVGHDEFLLKKLINTNWIRTLALLVQGLIATYCVFSALK